MLHVGPSTDPKVPDPRLEDWALPSPMTAGADFTVSFNIENRNFTGTVELWGAREACGAGYERLFSETLTTKVYCGTFRPTQAYSHMLFLLRYTGPDGVAQLKYDQATVCPSGRCP
jgi:hypothetical protein